MHGCFGTFSRDDPMTAEPPAEHELVITRVFDAPRSPDTSSTMIADAGLAARMQAQRSHEQ